METEQITCENPARALWQAIQRHTHCIYKKYTGLDFYVTTVVCSQCNLRGSCFTGFGNAREFSDSNDGVSAQDT
jgi:hypothetical protein